MIFEKYKEIGVELSNKDKDLILEEIDTPKDDEGYYLDAYLKRISFNSIRQLKGQKTEMRYNQYQEEELRKIKEDFFYFRENYCKIVTRNGLARPEPRAYQRRLEEDLIKGHDTLAFFPRQSGKTVTIATFLLWKAITATETYNIGISANVLDLASEVLDKIKKIYVNLPIWIQPGIVTWNKRSIELDNGCRIMTSASNSDAFRGYTINLLYCDETAHINNRLFQEFTDAVIPSLSSLSDSQAIYSSTANGLNHWYSMVQGSKEMDENGIGKNGYVLCEASWKEVPRFNKDGTPKSPEKFREEQISQHGEVYFNQNYGNIFLGSSRTLIGSEALKNLKPINENEVIKNSLFNGLRIFEEPKPLNKYIVTCDPKIDGADLVGIHVINVTSLPFRQVASANLHESYLLISSRLFDLGTKYNDAMIVVENNIDMTIADALFYQYEYQGEVFAEANKNKLGFRTTTKTKRITTSMLKKFIEEDLLILKDEETIKQLYNFIETDKGTFKAEDGFHDDLVMSLTMMFAPFLNVRDWNDFKGFVELMEREEKIKELEDKETLEFLDLGFFD